MAAWALANEQGPGVLSALLRRWDADIVALALARY